MTLTKKYGRISALISIAILIAATAQGQDLTIRGGWLFDSVADNVRPNSGIVVRGGKILEVDADINAADATLTLGDNDYILPGIFDLHAHYNINLVGEGRHDETEVVPVIFLANGVTTTFPAGEYDPADMMRMRKRIDKGKQPGPRVLNSGPYFGRWRKGWDNDITAEKIHDEVDYWVEQGVKGFKAKSISPPHLKALIERAHWHGLTVTGHLGSGFRNSVNPRDAILMGIDRIEHFLGGDLMPGDKGAYTSLQNLDPQTPELDNIIQLFIQHGVFFDATLSAYGYSGSREQGYDHWTDEQRFYTPYVQRIVRERPRKDIIEQFEKIYWIKLETVKRFFDAGGMLTLGTDQPSYGEYIAGFSVHRELHHFVLAGIPPADAIKAATTNAARAMNLGDKFGTIEAGKFADMFVITGNPLDDITNTRTVHTVIKAGVVYKTDELLKSVEGKMGQQRRYKPTRPKPHRR